MVIKILGSGCPNCKKLHQLVMEAVKEMSISADIIKITNMPEIIKYNIMMTPALVVNEKVVCSGRVPSKGEISKHIVNVLAKKGS